MGIILWSIEQRQLPASVVEIFSVLTDPGSTEHAMSSRMLNPNFERHCRIHDVAKFTCSLLFAPDL